MMLRSASEWPRLRPGPAPVPAVASSARRSDAVSCAWDHPLRCAAYADTIGFAASVRKFMRSWRSRM
eukprot:13005527-Alexandrium_andersonii.AAC.1